MVRRLILKNDWKRVNTLAAALCYGPGRDSARPNAGSRRPATSARTLAVERVPENYLPMRATSLPCVGAGRSHTPDESERGIACGLGPGPVLERSLLVPRGPPLPSTPKGLSRLLIAPQQKYLFCVLRSFSLHAFEPICVK